MAIGREKRIASTLRAGQQSTLRLVEEPETLAMNDIARVRLRTQRPLAVDSYRRNRVTGAFIVIDEATNRTVAAGTVA